MIMAVGVIYFPWHQLRLMRLPLLLEMGSSMGQFYRSVYASKVKKGMTTSNIIHFKSELCLKLIRLGLISMDTIFMIQGIRDMILCPPTIG